LACKNGFDQIAFLLVEKIKIENLIELNTKGLPLHLTCKNKEEKLNLVNFILNKIKNEANPHEILIKSYYSNLNKNEDFNYYLNEILNKFDYNDQSVLSILVEMNHLNIIELLLKEFFIYIQNFQDKNGNLLIHLAAKSGSTDLLKLLIKYDLFSLNLNNNKENGLHIAASYNKFNFIKEYLAHEKTYINNLLLEGENLDQAQKSFLKSYIPPSVKRFNIDKKTPLFIAVINGYPKCIEALTASEDLDLEDRDSNGNTVYHVCAKVNNFESIRYLLTRKDPKYLKALYIDNDNDETVTHVACKYGNLEVIRLVLSKINEGFSSVEAYLSARNKDGLTCFHLACIHGFYNIAEYFLKDLKMKFFLEFLDNNLNNCMHLATIYGQYSIASILNEFNLDISVKNIDDDNPLEIAFKKGYFDIVKLLITSTSSLAIEEGTKNEFMIHIAAYEGNAEIVELLLSKNVAIDVLNLEKKNCLDVAISRNNREVIKVLLNDKNWFKLINLYSPEEKKVGDLIVREENPQLNTMFQKKMWEPILQILGKTLIIITIVKVIIKV
jgi:ankyrin repeat protein